MVTTKRYTREDVLEALNGLNADQGLTRHVSALFPTGSAWFYNSGADIDIVGKALSDQDSLMLFLSFRGWTNCGDIEYVGDENSVIVRNGPINLIVTTCNAEYTRWYDGTQLILALREMGIGLDKPSRQRFFEVLFREKEVADPAVVPGVIGETVDLEVTGSGQLT